MAKIKTEGKEVKKEPVSAVDPIAELQKECRSAMAKGIVRWEIN